MEVQAEVLIKATKVGGVFESDPVQNKDAKKFDKIGYIDVLNKGLRVMDSTAITLCMENKLPIQVLNLREKGAFARFVNGENVGTIISNGES